MTQFTSKRVLTKLSRREVFQSGGVAAALTLLRGSSMPAKTDGGNLYTRIGVRPFINLTATYTINGGALTRPPAKQPMEEASHYHLHLHELTKKDDAPIAN